MKKVAAPVYCYCHYRYQLEELDLHSYLQVLYRHPLGVRVDEEVGLHRLLAQQVDSLPSAGRVYSASVALG